jgi:hypothetical protein
LVALRAAAVGIQGVWTRGVIPSIRHKARQFSPTAGAAVNLTEQSVGPKLWLVQGRFKVQQGTTSLFGRIIAVVAILLIATLVVWCVFRFWLGARSTLRDEYAAYHRMPLSGSFGA